MIIVDETLPVGDIPPPFPPRNVEVKFDANIRDSYDLKKEIGRGRFGTVYLCTCKTTGLKFAAKFVNTKRNQDRENVEREIEIMKVLSGKGADQKLIQLYDAYDMGKEMCLVLEIVNGGELFERVIDDDFELTERACAIFIKQICEGIEFIHSKNILHLDMKPENILCLSREGNRIKICDFGLARKYDPRKKLQVLFGTPEFVAPEVVNFEPISFGTDMWSIGVICYVLLSGLSPFMGHNYVETMTNVTHNKYDFDDEAFDDVSDDVKDFIERLLILDKSERLTPAQCYRHRWLRSLETTQPTTLNSKSSRRISCVTTDLNENGRMSPDTETETTEDFSSSMDLVVDAKLDIKLTGGDNIDRNIRERNLNESEQKNNVIIVNVKEPNPTKSDEINANIQDNNNLTNTHSGNNNQEDNTKNLKRRNSDANVTNNNYDNSEAATEHFEKRKKLKEFEKQELDRTKSNLKEFVERWNSQTNSPYMIASPKLPSVICKLADGMYSQELLPALDDVHPSNSNVLKNEDIDKLSETQLQQFQSFPSVSPLSSIKIVQELEQKLESLQNERKEKEILTEKEKDNRINEAPKHPNIIALQKESSETHLSTKTDMEKDKLQEKLDTDNKKTERNTSAGKQKPSRDVISQPEKKYEKDLSVKSPEQGHTPLHTPGKRSRKTSTSRERDDRPGSRDSNRSTPAQIRRRPSRDVPLTLTQIDRISSLADPKTLDRKSTLDLWPDMICLTKDDSDSNESENDYRPITGKLELPMKVPSSVQKDSSAPNIPKEPSQNKSTNLKKTKSCDDAQSESKTVTWVLDLENAKIPFISQNNKASKDDKITYLNEKETKNDETSKKTLKPSTSGCQDNLTKSPSSSNIDSTPSFENLTIQTPWGPMRRSPSKTSLKGDEAPIINISECFINITKPKGEGNSRMKSTPSIELKMATPTGRSSSCLEKTKVLSEKSKVIENDNCKDSNPVNTTLQCSTPNNEHQYKLTSSTSFGKYSVTIPNNIKTTKMHQEQQNNENTDKTDQKQVIKFKKKELNNSDTEKTRLDNNISKDTFSVSHNEIKQIPSPKNTIESLSSNLLKNERVVKINRSDELDYNANKTATNTSGSTKQSTNPITMESCTVQNIKGKSSEIVIPIKREPLNKEETKPFKKEAQNTGETKPNTNSAAEKTKGIEIVIPIKMESFGNEKVNEEKRKNSMKENSTKDIKEKSIVYDIPIQKDYDIKEAAKSLKAEKPIMIQIQSDENNTYPPVTRKRSLDRQVKQNLSSESVNQKNKTLLTTIESSANNKNHEKQNRSSSKDKEDISTSNSQPNVFIKNNHSINCEAEKDRFSVAASNENKYEVKKNFIGNQDSNTSITSKKNSGIILKDTNVNRKDSSNKNCESLSVSTNLDVAPNKNEKSIKDFVDTRQNPPISKNNLSTSPERKENKENSWNTLSTTIKENDDSKCSIQRSKPTILFNSQKINHQNDSLKTKDNLVVDKPSKKLEIPSKFNNALDTTKDFETKPSNLSLGSSISMISIPTSVDEEGPQGKNNSSLIKPQPPHHKSDTIQTDSVNKRRSLVETEPFSTNSLKRKSSKTNLSTSKKSLGAMLFSAQDRISQFEKKKEDPEGERTQKPFIRSKTSTLISDNQSKIKSTINRSSLCENNKVPSIVCSKSEFSTIAFARNRLLNKA